MTPVAIFIDTQFASLELARFISFITTQHQDTQYNVLNSQDIKESVCDRNYKKKHITKIKNIDKLVIIEM